MSKYCYCLLKHDVYNSLSYICMWPNHQWPFPSWYYWTQLCSYTMHIDIRHIITIGYNFPNCLSQFHGNFGVYQQRYLHKLVWVSVDCYGILHGRFQLSNSMVTNMQMIKHLQYRHCKITCMLWLCFFILSKLFHHNDVFLFLQNWIWSKIWTRNTFYWVHRMLSNKSICYIPLVPTRFTSLSTF